MLTDKFILDYKIDNFADVILSKSTQLCVALVVEAFEQMGCSLKRATAGQKLEHQLRAQARKTGGISLRFAGEGSSAD